MKQRTTLIDFQIFARPNARIDQRGVNEALFASYEPLRLWLKEHVLNAPFRKILVTLADATTSAQWDGTASNSGGVCEVTMAVDIAALEAHVLDHRWVLALVSRALVQISRALNWDPEQLEKHVTDLGRQEWPLVTFLEHLQRSDQAGNRFIPWFSTRPGQSELGVQIETRDRETIRVILLSRDGPLYLEDDFPVVGSELRDSWFVLLDKNGRSIGRVPVV